MTETGDPPPKSRRRRRCFIIGGAILSVLLLIFIIILILAFTLFKPKDPKFELLSATLDGISPRISFPVVNIQLNVTLNLQLLLHNPNYARFKHGPGKSIILYRENEVGQADIGPGLIPSRGSVTLPVRLTIEIDEITSKLTTLIGDLLIGQLVMETRTRIPGRVTFLGIIKRHAIAISECRFTFDIHAMKIKSQECKSRTKL